VEVIEEDLRFVFT